MSVSGFRFWARCRGCGHISRTVDDYAAHASRCRTDTKPVLLADWRRRQLEDQWARTFRGRA